MSQLYRDFGHSGDDPTGHDEKENIFYVCKFETVSKRGTFRNV